MSRGNREKAARMKRSLDARENNIRESSFLRLFLASVYESRTLEY